MVRTVVEIIEQAQRGAANAPIDEMKNLFSLVGDLALHLKNLELHIKRLEAKRE